MTPMAWKGGELVECTMGEFVNQLRTFAVLCAREFSARSDSIGHASERFDMAADVIEALASAQCEGSE